jgi:hypothetical protein
MEAENGSNRFSIEDEEPPDKSIERMGAVHASGNSCVSGGWLPPLMLIVER